MRFTFLDIGLIVLSILPLIRFEDQIDKVNCGLWIALVLCLKALYSSSLKIRNRWLILAFATMPFVYKYGFFRELMPFIVICVYALMYAGLSQKEAERSLNIVLYCGLGISLYSILQFLGFESVHILNIDNINGLNTPSHRVVGLLGNPTYLGAYLAMLVPLALREGRYIFSAIFILAVFLTKSNMAIGAMISSLVCLPFLLNRKMFIIGSVIAIVIFGVLGFNYKKIHVNDNGRFDIWSKTVNDIQKGIEITHKVTGQKNNKQFGLFGFGAGSYRKLFPKMHKTTFVRAHNEYLQACYEFGIVVLLFFMLFILFDIFQGRDVFTKASLICICLCAMGTFVWQSGMTQFLSVYVLCLNKREQEF